MRFGTERVWFLRVRLVNLHHSTQNSDAQHKNTVKCDTRLIQHTPYLRRLMQNSIHYRVPLCSGLQFLIIIMLTTIKPNGIMRSMAASVTLWKRKMLHLARLHHNIADNLTSPPPTCNLPDKMFYKILFKREEKMDKWNFSLLDRSICPLLELHYWISYIIICHISGETWTSYGAKTFIIITWTIMTLGIVQLGLMGLSITS